MKNSFYTVNFGGYTMSLSNLSYIGHCGNFMLAGDVDKEFSKSSSAPHIMALYNNAFDFGGTGDLFAGTGIMNVGASEMSEIGASVTAATDNSHNIKILTFGLDSIFRVGQSGLLPNLEALGLLKYMDIATMVGGLKLPPVAGLPLGKGR